MLLTLSYSKRERERVMYTIYMVGRINNHILIQKEGTLVPIKIN